CSLVTSLFSGCPQTTCTITASPASVQPSVNGQIQPVTLTWQAQNAQYASISGVGTVPYTGSYVVYPQTSQSYSMQVSGQYGTNSCSANVTVQNTSQLAPYGRGTDGQACVQPPTQPDPAQCTAGTWKPLYSTNNCLSNWQCIPVSASCPTQPAQPPASSCQGSTWNPSYQNGTSCITGWICGGPIAATTTPVATTTPPVATSTPPEAHISCAPSVADVGMDIAISYSCKNADRSAGTGFYTLGSLEGSTSTTARRSGNENTMTFVVTCQAGASTVTDQCVVQVSQPSIVFTANPQSVTAGATTTLGWTTGGMQACTVSSPDLPAFTTQNANATSTTGVAVTPALATSTRFALTCTTLGGGTIVATTSVAVSAAATTTPHQSSVQVQSNADGKNTIAHGSTVHITWIAESAPASAAMSIWLYDVNAQQVIGLITGGRNPTGSYDWKIPSATSTCDQNSPFVCGQDLAPGGGYAIEAALYSPKNAYLGGVRPAGAPDPQYIDYDFARAFTLLR
ncbi:MAG: hypothetical protein JO019_01100, partial [Candidatus Kaiserbacteria bacterium]|nr:hypothetical protein [Candidatus Kaiserbacteria bacterium]